MASKDAPHISIGATQLEQFASRATGYLRNVTWKPKNTASSTQGRTGWIESRSSVLVDDQLSLLKVAQRVSKDEAILTDSVNHVLQTMRTGLQIGMHLALLYMKASGLEILAQQNARGALPTSQQDEYRLKHTTASAIAVFTASAYIVWELSRYRSEEVSAVKLDFPGIPEMNFMSPTTGLACLVYYFAAFAERSGFVNTDTAFVKAALLYFAAALDEINVQKGTLQHVEPFTDKAYKLENSDFAVHGFEADMGQQIASVTFNRVEFHEMVGNRDAKHKARRWVHRLLCYDPRVQKNPMQDLGALPSFVMGMGVPGTGKSMLIAITATLLDDMCRMIGTPFLFWAFPDNIVSTFQGGSAERATEWFRPLRDPKRIIFAPIDDAENTLEERTRQGVSAGVREVIGVVLRNTEGAYAVNFGNSLLSLWTNLPEQVDKAVLSRIQDRIAIDGAKTVEDILDQHYQWWKKYPEIFGANFINLADPKSYEYLSAQRELKTLGELYQATPEPTVDIVRDVFDRVSKRFDPRKHQEFYAHFEHGIQQKFPWYTSRDIRNIQRNVDSRIMDFDFEPDWLTDPARFFHKPYDEKKGMIVELMQSNLGGAVVRRGASARNYPLHRNDASYSPDRSATAY